MDKNKHKLYMAQILSLIFKDKELCNALAFKGGTSLMFFHNLGRFSTDLDFNLLVPDKLDIVYDSHFFYYWRIVRLNCRAFSYFDCSRWCLGK